MGGDPLPLPGIGHQQTRFDQPITCRDQVEQPHRHAAHERDNRAAPWWRTEQETPVASEHILGIGVAGQEKP
ncbi:hypothetical protein Atai01_32330 [Amycolatopsis taiwanensis]|uniref:Uncharacterized protein n=1 Tax=Amycolatopsis taiwanensis TaxID=342230 RepID=A0A9W6QZX2_9PSEU|nr:hypothetical protein Atai01_32330 [Amycolatopsis taiwanensis]